MKKPLLEYIYGWKVYIGLAFGFVLWLGWVVGWWSLDQVKELVALDGLFLGLGVRSAMKKMESGR